MLTNETAEKRVLTFTVLPGALKLTS